MSPRASLPFPTLSHVAVRVSAPCPPEFRRALEDAEVRLPEDTLRALESYTQLLLGAGELLNLTAFREPESIWSKLLLDALLLTPLLGRFGAGCRGIDVGCGAGIPGIPLALALPELHVTLLDGTSKKIAFVQHVLGELGLRNARALVGRAEVLAAAKPVGSHREAYDVVVARAVAPLRTLLELTVPFAKAPTEGAGTPGGLILLPKGEHASDELAQAGTAMQQLGVELAAVKVTATGQVLLFEKRVHTPERFPRRDGTPKRNPL